MQLNPLYIPDANSANTGGNIEQFQFKSLSVIFADMIKIFSAENDKPITFDKDTLTNQLPSDDLQVSKKVSLFNFEPNNYNSYDSILPLTQSNLTKIASDESVLELNISSIDKVIESIEFLSFELTQEGNANCVKEDIGDLHNYITKAELPKLTECILNFIKQNGKEIEDSSETSMANSSKDSGNNIIDELSNDLHNALIKNIPVLINIEGATETLEIRLSPVIIDVSNAEENYLFFPENDESGIKTSNESFNIKAAVDKREVFSQTNNSAEFKGLQTVSKSEAQSSISLNHSPENDIAPKNNQLVFSIKLIHKTEFEQKEVISSKIVEVIQEKDKSELLTFADTKSRNQENTFVKTENQNESEKRIIITRSDIADENRPGKIIPPVRKILETTSPINLSDDKIKISMPERMAANKSNSNHNTETVKVVNHQSSVSEKINGTSETIKTEINSTNVTPDKHHIPETKITLEKENVLQPIEIKSDNFIVRDNITDNFKPVTKVNEFVPEKSDDAAVSGKIVNDPVEKVKVNVENEFVDRTINRIQKINEHVQTNSENGIDEQFKTAPREIPLKQKEPVSSPEEKSVLGDIIRSFNKISSKLTNEESAYRITVRPVFTDENNHSNDNTQQFAKRNYERQVFSEPVLNEKQDNVSINKEIVNSNPTVKEFTLEKNETIIKNEAPIAPVIQVTKPIELNVQKNISRQMNNFIESLKYLLSERKGNSEIRDISVNKRSDNEIELRLMPERLGKIKVKLNVLDNHLNATLEVESKAVQSIVSNNIDYLKNSLTQQGLQLNSVSISLFSQETKSGKSFSHKKKQINSDAGKGEVDSIPHQITKSLGYNTYEYIA